MRPVKAALFGLMVLSLAWMWSARHAVVDAYTTSPGTLDIRLSGVDLAVERTGVGPSPYRIPPAPDTRRKPLALLFTTSSTIEPPTIEMTDGTATLRGTAVGPDGPAHGAIVRIERHTSEGLASVDVRVGPDGRWRALNLPGGRFRVRAWVPGLLTARGSTVLFVDADAQVELDFVLFAVHNEPSFELIHGGPIFEGSAGAVAVELTQRVVDAEGLIATTPIVGAAVTMATTAEMTVENGATQVTGDDGVAWFRVRCTGTGQPNAVVRHGASSAWVELPACRPLPPPEPTTTTVVPGPPASDAVADGKPPPGTSTPPGGGDG